MAGFPTRTNVHASYWAADQDTRPETFGYCVDRWFVDGRALPQEQRDPGAPPAANEAFWAQATTSNLLLVPELRGAILSPRYRFLPADQYLTPCVPTDDIYSTFQARPWAGSGVASDWWRKTHQELGGKVALYTPNAVAPPLGCVRTLTQQPVDRAFCVRVCLFAGPPGENDDGRTAVAQGFRLHMGVRSGLAQLTATFPVPHASDDTTNSRWLWRWTGPGTYELCDKVEQERLRPGDASVVKEQTVAVVPICGRLLILSSDAPPWVYQPATPLEIREGHVAIEVFGCRAWVQWGWVLFPDTCAVFSPTMTYGAHWTQSPVDLRFRALVSRHDDPEGDAFYEGRVEDIEAGDGWFSQQLWVRAENRSTAEGHGVGDPEGRRYTPLLFSLQEVRRATLTPASGEPFDIAPYIRSIRLRTEASRRGRTATVRLRNWRGPDETGSGYERGALDSVLRGIGRWELSLAHQRGAAEDPPQVVFAGYSLRERPVVGGMRPEVECELMDLTLLLKRQPMLWTVAPGGWDLKEYVELLLGNGGFPPDETCEWPTDYADSPAAIPLQQTSAAGKLGPDTDLVQALDRLCELCRWTWDVTAAGKLRFRRLPIVPGAPVYILTAPPGEREEMVLLPVEATRDYADSWTYTYARGRDSAGFDQEVIYRAGPAVLDNPTDPRYVGRVLWRVEVQPDNPEPARIAAQLCEQGARVGQRLGWSTLWRGLEPGDVVESRVDYLRLRAGTTFAITETETEVTAGGQLPRAWSRYTAEILRVPEEAA